MNTLLCPACQRPVRPAAGCCDACGVALVDAGAEADTVPGVLYRDGAVAEAPGPQVGALWLDDLRPPSPRPVAAVAAARTGATTAAVIPGLTVHEIVLAAPAALAAPAPRLPAAPALPAAPLAEPPADRAARAAVKTARRAAVRRARLAAAPLAMVCDILLVDADAGARQQLAALLDGFGFHVRPVATLAQAAVLAAHHTFAAVVVAVDPEAIDGAVHDLFEQVRCTAGRAGCAAAVRVLVAAQWRPVDRVRAELAGCEETLACPVGSRDLARVLDIHGIALPHDPRRF